MSSAGSMVPPPPSPPPLPPLPPITVLTCYEMDLDMLIYAARLAFKRMHATDCQVGVYIQATFDLGDERYWHCIVNGEMTENSPIWSGKKFAKFVVEGRQFILYKTIA